MYLNKKYIMTTTQLDTKMYLNNFECFCFTISYYMKVEFSQDKTKTFC